MPAPDVIVRARVVDKALAGASSGALDADRIMGVETGGCPHTAIREDASINLAAVAEMAPGLMLTIPAAGVLVRDIKLNPPPASTSASAPLEKIPVLVSPVNCNEGLPTVPRPRPVMRLPPAARFPVRGEIRVRALL